MWMCYSFRPFLFPILMFQTDEIGFFNKTIQLCFSIWQPTINVDLASSSLKNVWERIPEVCQCFYKKKPIISNQNCKRIEGTVCCNLPIVISSRKLIKPSGSFTSSCCLTHVHMSFKCSVVNAHPEDTHTHWHGYKDIYHPNGHNGVCNDKHKICLYCFAVQCTLWFQMCLNLGVCMVDH